MLYKEVVNKPDVLKDFKVLHQQVVSWGDMDSMQHVNNTKYFYYCESARMDFIREMFPNLPAPDQLELAGSASIGLALAETKCRFKVPLTYPDEVLVATRVVKIEDTQFLLMHAIYSTKLGLIAAEAEARMVCFDYAKGRRANLDDGMIAALNAYK